MKIVRKEAAEEQATVAEQAAAKLEGPKQHNALADAVGAVLRTAAPIAAVALVLYGLGMRRRRC